MFCFFYRFHLKTSSRFGRNLQCLDITSDLNASVLHRQVDKYLGHVSVFNASVSPSKASYIFCAVISVLVPQCSYCLETNQQYGTGKYFRYGASRLLLMLVIFFTFHVNKSMVDAHSPILPLQYLVWILSSYHSSS